MSEPIAEKAAAVARYHAGCLRTIGAQNVGLRDLRTTKKAALACDIGSLAEFEELMTGGRVRLTPPVLDGEPGSPERDSYEYRLGIWDRARELARKAAVEAHNKEVTYGSPLLSGYLKRANRSETVLAPLFMQAVEVLVSDDGSIEILAKDEPPRFNTVLWADALSSGDADQVIGLGIDAQADLAERYDPDRIRTLLNGISTVFPGLDPETPEGKLSEWPPRPSPSEVRGQEPALRLHDGAAIYLSNRASPYLLADLERVADDPTPVLVDDRPLSILVSPPSDAEQPELVSPDIDEVEFPFPSNEAQRRVADALDKNRVVVVQGPPGNGKSLTIANLVCHFVAQGKSVLVTSHKDQALNVVREKLAETDLQFLFATLIGGTGAAKRELQGQIQDVQAFAGAVNSSTLRKQLKDVEKRRKASGKKYRQLRDEFNKRAEPEQQEAAELLLELEPIHTLPTQDQISDDPSVTGRALERLNELGRSHSQNWGWLTEGQISMEQDLSDQITALAAFLDLQSSRLTAAQEPNVRSAMEAWHKVTDDAPDEISACRDAVNQCDAALREVLSEVNQEQDPAELRLIATDLAAAPDLLQDAEAQVATLQGFFASARQMSEARNHVNGDPARRAEIALQHSALQQILKRRGARKWLDEHAPGASGLAPEAVNEWRDFWDAWFALRTLAEGLPGGLRAEIGEAFDPGEAAAAIKRARIATELAIALRLARQASRTTRCDLDIDRLTDSESDADFERTVSEWLSALTALDADRLGNKAKSTDDLSFAGDRASSLDGLIDSGAYEEASVAIEELRAVQAALPALAERRSLLDGPLNDLPEAVRQVEAAIIAGGPEPPFLGDIDAAIAAHPSVRKLNAIRKNRLTSEIAEELRALRVEVLEDARKLLGLRIQDRIVKGFRSPRFLASLATFGKAIRTSAKRFERIEALKDSDEFDVGILTDVFPCWIMRPEEACRLFPLEPDVFDVVIFDEASQCNPDQAIPLFARGKRAAVFGDAKQLSNEDLKRSLAGNSNKALLRQSGLDELDPMGLFDQTRNSLLDLLSSRQQASIVLNEHFRCRPEIIGFSNNAFYGDALQVMRDREDDHGLGHPLMIREVTDVPDLGKSKVNPYEAKSLVHELKARLSDPRYARLSFGVLSLFRDQIEYIAEIIEAEVPVHLRDQHRLICSTVDGFQGDERDVILYSWRFAPSSSPSILAFTNGEAGSQRSNVALTRARHQAIHFISSPVNRFPSGSLNVTGFLKHAANPERLMAKAESRIHHEPQDAFRMRIAGLVRDAGFEVEERFVAGGYSIDLKVADPVTGSRVAVFVDSTLDPLPPATVVRRIDAQSMLERAGWRIVRLPASEAIDDDFALTSIRSALAEVEPSSGESIDEPSYLEISSESDVTHEEVHVDSTISPEDLADFDWEAPTLDSRLKAGEDVFQSDFERQLYDRLSPRKDLRVTPQWPTRGKFIDLVVTDSDGRRIAVEADGDIYHEAQDGSLIPEDLQRQEYLEDAGWVFHRVRYSDFKQDPEQSVAEVLGALAGQPANPLLAAASSPEDDAAETRSVPDQPPAPETTSQPIDDEDSEADHEPLTASRSDEEIESGRPPADAASESSQSERESPGIEFDDISLDLIPMLLVAIVRDHGDLSDEEIGAAFDDAFPSSGRRSRLINSFAWYASAKGCIMRNADESGWTVATGTEPLPAICSLSINDLAERSREIAERGVKNDQIFDHLVEEVQDGRRLPRPYARAIGAAIWKSQH